MKAKKTGFVIYGKYSNFVEYEYRGETYEVEFSNCMTYLCPAPAVQHEVAQMEIDKRISERSQPKKEIRYEDTAEYGFNLFLDYVENGKDF